MTIANTVRKAGPFTCNAVTTVFPFTFKVFTAVDVVVSLTDSFGVITTLALTSNYTVALNSNQDVSPGGTVTTVLTYAVGYLITLTSGVAATQQVVLTNTGGFYPDVLNAEFDRLTILIQQQQEVTSRSLVFPISDTANAPLPPASQRVGKFLGFDSFGAPVILSGVGTDGAMRTDLAAPTGAALIGFSQGGTGAGTRTVQQKLGDIVSVSDYPDSLAAGAITATSFRNALAKITSNGGGTLNIPRGSYTMASVDLASPLLLTSNTVIEGNGSIITVSGVAIINSMFRASDASNILIRNLLVVGNSVAVADASSGAFLNFLQTAAGTGIENLFIDNVRLSNFAAERWISVLNFHATNPINKVVINNLKGFSLAGNSLAPASIGVGANLITIYGVTAPIINVVIRDLYVDATYIKRGIDIFHLVQNVLIDRPYIYNAGRNGANDDCGGYAINCYGGIGEQFGVVIRDPIIIAPRSCGIYLRGLDNASVTNPTISGQTDTTVTTLPKGAIVGDGSTNVSIRGGNLTNNAFDVYVASSGLTTFNWRIVDGFKATGATTGGLVLNPGAGSGFCSGFFVDASCEFAVASGKAITLRNNIGGTGNSVSNFTYLGKASSLTNSAIDLNGESSATANTTKAYTLGGSYGAGAAAFAIKADCCAGDITILPGTEVYDATVSGSLSNAGLFANSTTSKLNILGLLARDMGGGYGVNTIGAGGTQNDIRIRNVTNPFSPTSMGTSVPLFGGGLSGDYVQKLGLVEAGVAASKYVTQGWRFVTGSGWLEQRTLTGN